MTHMQMLNELREHHIVVIMSHADGRAAVTVRDAQGNHPQITYYGELESCIARAWAGEPGDTR